MVPKQQADPKDPPPADSSDEEKEELPEIQLQSPASKKPQNLNSSESESNQSFSEEEEEEEKKKSSVQKSGSDQSSSEEEEEAEEKKKASVQKSDYGLDEEDVAGSDTDTTDTTPLKVEPKADVKPKLAQVVIASPAKSAISNQKKGKVSASGADEKKSPAFTRVFGDDDEVAVLKGMDEFRKKSERDLNVDRDGFFEFMKKTLKIEVSKAQLMDKVRRLKKKYQNHAKKGEDPVIIKPHELKLYELSKKVWGGEGAESDVKAVKRKAVKDAGSDDVASKGAKSNKKAKVNMDVVVNENDATKGGLELGEKVKSDPEEGWDAYPYFKEALEVESSEYYFKRLVDFNKIGPKKAKEMDDLWRAYHAKELEYKLARAELQEKTRKLVRDTLKS